MTWSPSCHSITMTSSCSRTSDPHPPENPQRVQTQVTSTAVSQTCYEIRHQYQTGEEKGQQNLTERLNLKRC